jgi:DNA topoisomerase I
MGSGAEALQDSRRERPALGRARVLPIPGRMDRQVLCPGPDEDLEARARSVGLRYVDPGEPGYTRRRVGKGFSYRDWNGRTVRDSKLRRRFEALVIPPAWTEVWICRYATGHLQAIGRDAAGRRQYLYHPRWREASDGLKYERMLAFARLLPRIRRRVERDLGVEGLSREKVLAAVVRLLESSLARVGSDRYARDNGTFGLTTLRKRHVEPPGEEGEPLVLSFDGKGGRPWRVAVEDPEVAEVVGECLEMPGYQLFKYVDAEGARREVSSDDVNAYLREAAGEPVTAKDFRTWTGTVLAAVALQEVERAAPEAKPREKIVRAIERVAEELGNTPAICREAYIHPELLAGFEEGRLLRHFERRHLARTRRDLAGLAPQEAAVLAFLEQRFEG